MDEEILEEIRRYLLKAQLQLDLYISPRYSIKMALKHTNKLRRKNETVKSYHH